MCLERCGDNSSMIMYELIQISEHRDIITGVSFEMFNLGPNSTLVQNNLTIVGPVLVAMGLETYPMVSSYPYPPEFIDWYIFKYANWIGYRMRQVFKDPYPFMMEAITQ